ncbi:hypothetical protein HDV00_011381 [Rhizophlyctis rosea]|nr:hypothetical protein HDV00_011381 [Rhizophlyctis rosea]
MNDDMSRSASQDFPTPQTQSSHETTLLTTSMSSESLARTSTTASASPPSTPRLRPSSSQSSLAQTPPPSSPKASPKFSSARGTPTRSHTLSEVDFLKKRDEINASLLAKLRADMAAAQEAAKAAEHKAATASEEAKHATMRAAAAEDREKGLKVLLSQEQEKLKVIERDYATALVQLEDEGAVTHGQPGVFMEIEGNPLNRDIIEAMLNDLQDQLSAAQKELSDRNTEIADLRKKYEEERNAKSSAMADKIREKRMRNSYEQDNEKLRKEVANLKSRLGEREKECEGLRARFDVLERRFEEKEKECRGLLTEVGDVKGRLEEKERECERLASESSESRSTLEELTARFEERGLKLNVLRAEVEEGTRRLADLESVRAKEVQFKTEIIAEKERETEGLRSALSIAEVKVRELEALREKIQSFAGQSDIAAKDIAPAHSPEQLFSAPPSVTASVSSATQSQYLTTSAPILTSLPTVSHTQSSGITSFPPPSTLQPPSFPTTHSLPDPSPTIATLERLLTTAISDSQNLRAQLTHTTHLLSIREAEVMKHATLHQNASVEVEELRKAYHCACQKVTDMKRERDRVETRVRGCLGVGVRMDQNVRMLEGRVGVLEEVTKRVGGAAGGGVDVLRVLGEVEGTWKRDGDVSGCEEDGCGVLFGVVKRRHHCRRCGGIYCGEHVGRWVTMSLGEKVWKEGGVRGRVCGRCFEEVQTPSEHPLPTFEALLDGAAPMEH